MVRNANIPPLSSRFINTWVPKYRILSGRGFPTNLRELSLSGANICGQVFEFGLYKLTSLTFLWIGYGIMDSFPEEEDGKTMLMLPTSLTTLRFFEILNLKFLSPGSSFKTSLHLKNFPSFCALNSRLSQRSVFLPRFSNFIFMNVLC